MKKKYRIKATWWPYGSRERELIEEYDAESEDEAKRMFWDNHPSMCGTGSIWKVEEI